MEAIIEQPAKNYISPEEYLVMEEAAEYKNEYYKGEIFNVAGTTTNHNIILGNLHTSLIQAQSKYKCLVFFSDIKLWIEKHKLFTYPDLFLVCNKLRYYPGRKDTITNPSLIFEILSESTKSYDRGKKFLFYRSIPAFKEYVLVDQDSIHVEHYNISPGDKWQLIDYNDVKEQLQLKTIDVQIPLQDIYRNVEFEK